MVPSRALCGNARGRKFGFFLKFSGGQRQQKGGGRGCEDQNGAVQLHKCLTLTVHASLTRHHLYSVSACSCSHILLPRSRTRLSAPSTPTWTSPTRAGRSWSWATRPPTCSPASTQAPHTRSLSAPARPRVTAPPSSPSSPPRFQVSCEWRVFDRRSPPTESLGSDHVSAEARQCWFHSFILICPVHIPVMSEYKSLQCLASNGRCLEASRFQGFWQNTSLWMESISTALDLNRDVWKMILVFQVQRCRLRGFIYVRFPFHFFSCLFSSQLLPCQLMTRKPPWTRRTAPSLCCSNRPKAEEHPSGRIYQCCTSLKKHKPQKYQKVFQTY